MVVAALAFAMAALTIQIASCLVAAVRCRAGQTVPAHAIRPPVSIVRPLNGLEDFSRETVGAGFALDYPCYELIFCVAQPNDPVIPLVDEAIRANPQVPARLLIGEDMISTNPKLNNMAKGFHAARHDLVAFVDSNVLIPPDYIDRLLHAWEGEHALSFLRMPGQAGMVTAPPAGQRPRGFWAELECAFLNSFQARVQYTVDTFGYGFAQGKTLFYRRADLERGGLESLSSEPAEDAASTKMMHRKGKQIRLAGPPFPQLIGNRTARQFWSRQLRWARLRRASFPLHYMPEILAGPVLPVIALGFAAANLGLSPGALALFLAAWYAGELALIVLARWPMNGRTPLVLIARDMLLPVLYFAALCGRSFDWHGKTITIAPQPRTPNAPEEAVAPHEAG